MIRNFLPALLALACLLGAAEPAAAQGGYSKEKYPEHGLSFELAKNFEWLAIQPNEDWVVLQWIYEERKSGVSKDKGRKGAAPKLQIIRIDYKADPGPSTPGGQGPSEDEDEEEEEPEEPEKQGPTGKLAKPALVLPINSWERYAEKRFDRWEAKEIGKGKPRDDFEATEYELKPKRGGSSGKYWAYVWEKSRTRSFIVLGTCGDKEFEDQRKIWRRTAEKMRFAEPVADPDVVKWERFYERRTKFKQPEYRIRVRKGLDGDWDAEDTENYIVIFNTKDQPLVRRIVKDLESIRKEYVKLFPAAGEIDAVSTVRICADRDEYMQYGGPGGSAGYWHWVTEELVLYDGTKREKGKSTDKLDTFIVLYHEAFHQYIHYSAGKLSPHSWFNEGYGDYFSGAMVKGGKVKKIGINRWRVATIKNAVENYRHTPWDEIIEYEQPQYYNRAKVGQNYAQGWSMIFFLNTSKKVQRDKRLKQILPIYFDTLKATWKEELAQLEAQGKDQDQGERAEGQLAARQAAVTAAFDGVDIDELEEMWIDFVNDLELK